MEAVKKKPDQTQQKTETSAFSPTPPEPSTPINPPSPAPPQVAQKAQVTKNTVSYDDTDKPLDLRAELRKNHKTMEADFSQFGRTWMM